MIDIAVATCRVLPEPDPDAAPLAAALEAAGIRHEALAWDDPTSDWGRAKLTLLRSTWNYPQAPEAFAGWAGRVAERSELWNPLPVVRWNLHKRYLIELDRQGIPTCPTRLVERGSTAPLAGLVDGDCVVKPAVSAASFRTLKVTADNAEEGEAHLRALAAERDVLVQPYLPSVEDHGERALVWVDGAVTHAVRKTPRFSGEDEAVSGPVPIAAAERELAERAIAAIGERVLYARVDVAPGPDGTPVVMELELLEPSLFFTQGPEALERFVSALSRRLAAI